MWWCFGSSSLSSCRSWIQFVIANWVGLCSWSKLKKRKSMVKQGPCCHCGITSTPLWRNGPPGKPVLCNACGSRWRTKGTLANYAPLHSRFFPPIGVNDRKSYRESNTLPKKKTNDLYKVNFPEYGTEVGETTPEHSQYDGDFNDGVNNNSSPGSGTSFSESCIQYGSLGGNDISGPVQSHFWHSHIPSRKRTSKKHQSPSPIEKLRRDLCDLQQLQSSYPSGSIEDLLFLEKEEDPTLSMETGLGGFPIKKPRPSVEEESVTSSFAAENKISSLNDVSMGSSSLDMHSQSDEISSSSAYSLRLTWDADKPRTMKENMPKHHDLANINSESSFHSNTHVLQNIHSLLPPKEMMVMTDERTAWEKERSSSSSHVIGARTLLQPNGSPNLTDCQTSEEARLEAQDHDTVLLRPAKLSLKTAMDSGSQSSFRESSDQLLMTCSNSNAAAATLSPNRISTMPASVKDDPVGILDKNFFIISPPHLSFYPQEFSYFKSHNKDQV